MNTDEKIQKLLQMQEQGESIESIYQALGLGSSRALSNLANRKGYKFDRHLNKYVPKERLEQIKTEHNKIPQSNKKVSIQSLEEEIKNLHKLINEKDKRILELEEELLKRPLNKHNARGAGRKELFSPEEKEIIKAYRLQGKTIKEISELYKCSVGVIHKLINE